jgi:predicted DNA-binding transcriptional regulator YafY
VKRLERLVGMALLLSARRRLRAEELAGRFDVSLRTVYRDVRSLQDAGFPVAGTAGDGYVLPAGSQLRPLALDAAEAEALALGARLLDTAADRPLRDRLRTALAKLEAILAPEAVRRLRDRESTVLMPKLATGDAGPVSVLLEAVSDRRVLHLAYQGLARTESTRREIEPLGLVRLGNVWLVPAYCRLRQDLRVFRTDLIVEARLTGETFVPREGLTLEDFVRLKAREPAPASPRASRLSRPRSSS